MMWDGEELPAIKADKVEQHIHTPLAAFQLTVHVQRSADHIRQSRLR